MIRKSILRVFAAFCFLVFITSVDAYLHPTMAQKCSEVTDQKIVADIYSRIKADKILASQISHINVVSVNFAVKVQGWANNKRDYDKVVGIVMATRCVKLVNVNLFEEDPPETENLLRSEAGCAPGTKPCVDVCIPVSDPCNISDFEQ
ncbi:MAG: BON domain-containing protein [Pyrinomonadaceae bacterium]